MASLLARVEEKGERGLSSRYRGVEGRGGAGRRNGGIQGVLHVSLQRGVLTPNSFFNMT